MHLNQVRIQSQEATKRIQEKAVEEVAFKVVEEFEAMVEEDPTQTINKMTMRKAIKVKVIRVSNVIFVKKYGHIEAYSCTKAKQQANYAEKKEEEAKLFLTYLNSNVSSAGLWILDSGCSNHMLGFKNLNTTTIL